MSTPSWKTEYPDWYQKMMGYTKVFERDKKKFVSRWKHVRISICQKTTDMKDVLLQRTDWMRTYKVVRKKEIALIDVMERLEIMEVGRVGTERWWTRWLHTCKSDVKTKSIIEYCIQERPSVRVTTRRPGTRTTDQDERRRRIPIDSFRSESYSHRLWNLENWSDHMKEIAFEWWNPTDTRTRSSVWRSFRLRSQKLERIRKKMFLISDCQWVSVSQDPSVSYIMKTMIIITFGIFLSDDIETLQNPRNSDESKTSNASICISSHSIFIVTFPHTSDMDLVTYEKSKKINACHDAASRIISTRSMMHEWSEIEYETWSTRALS